MSTDETPARPGTSADLAQRIGRLEEKYEGLASTVARVELNQTHAEELNKLRFASLETGIAGLTQTLGTFMTRVEGLVTGEVETQQSRAGREMVVDYQRWRADVDDRLDGHDEFETQGRLLGRLAVLLVGGNIAAIVVALAAILQP